MSLAWLTYAWPEVSSANDDCQPTFPALARVATAAEGVAISVLLATSAALLKGHPAGRTA